jgi:hypothetical protein
MPSDVLITPASSKIDFTDGANATKTLKITGTSLNIDTSFAIGATTANNTLSVLGSASIGSSYNVAGPTNGLIVQGNVGIGTTSPSSVLDVVGILRFDSLGASETRNVVNAAGQRIFAPGGGAKFLGNSSTGAIRIKSPINGSTDSFITIKGTIFEYAAGKSFDFLISGYYYTNSFANVTAQIIGGPYGVINRNFTIRIGRDTNNALLFYIGELADTWAYGYIYLTEVFLGWSINQGTLNSYQTGWSITNEASAFENVMATATDTQITNWSRSGTSTYYNLGNVGVGGTPSYKLDVNNGSSQFALRLLGSNADGPVIRFENTGASGRIYHVGSTLAASGAGAGFSIYDVTGSASRILINSNGNVGVGITNPSARLSTGTSSGMKLLVYDNPSTGVYTGLGQDLAAGNSTDLFAHSVSNLGFITFGKIGTNGSTYTEWGRFNPSGNLGIGTTNPTQLLDVRGNIKLGADNSGNYIYYVTNAENTIINTSRTDASQQGLLRSDGWGNFTVDKSIGVGYSLGSSFPSSTIGNGNLYVLNTIGVNTTSPLTKLDVRSGSITAGTNTSTAGTTIIAGYYTAGALTVLGTEQSSGGPVLGYAVTPSTSGTGAFLSATSIAIPRSAYTQDGGTHRWYIGASQTVAIGGAVTASEVMRINSSGNVGVGTTTVSYKLHVQGDIYARSAVINISGDLNALRGNVTTMGYNLTNSPSGAGWITVNTSQNFLSSGDILSQLAYDNYNQQKLFTRHSSNYGATWSAWKTIINSDAVSGTTNYVAKFTATNTLGNSLIFDNGSNVAIGSNATAFGRLQISAATTNPSLSATTPADVSLIISNSDIAYGTMFATYSDGKGALQQRRTNAATYYDFSLQPHGGNVGIGNTAPSATLHVNSTTSGATLLRADGTNGTLFSVIDDLSDSLMSVNNSAGLPVLEVFADDRVVMGQYGANDFVLVNNKIGLGTNNPQYELDIVGPGTNAAVNIITRIRSSASSDTFNTGSVIAFTNTTTNVNAYSYVGSRIDLGSAGDNAQALIFATNATNTLPTEKMRIKSDGNVGINTASPAYKLDVNGTSAFRDTVNIGPNIGTITWGNFGGGTGFGVRSESGRALSFGANGSFDHLVINTSGNVGVGTTNPGTSLEIYARPATSTTLRQMLIINTDFASASGTGFGGSIVFRGRTAGNLLRDNAQITAYNEDIGDNGYALGFFTRPNDTLGMVQRMTIARGGNVGIGTVSPAYKLQVDGTFNATGTSTLAAVSITGTITTSATEAMRVNNNNGYISIYNSAGSTRTGYIQGLTGSSLVFAAENSAILQFNVGGSERARIDTNGNVGIGTTVPVAYAGFTSLTIGNTSSIGLIKLRSAYSSGNGAEIYQSGSGHLFFNINSSLTSMYLKVDGNVGIGTLNPLSKLAVDGVTSVGPSSKLSLIGLDINSGATPTYVKIVTTIPVASPAADFTVNIKGFIYGASRNADISISWHYYLSTFYNPIAKSSGGWAPTIRLSAEGGFVAIVLSSPGYWPKFYVESMYSSAYSNQYSSGWSWVDADATGSPIVNVPYASNFGNNFVMLTDGNVGIGTASPATKLHVVGSSILANATSINPDSYLGSVVAGNVADGSGWGVTGGIAGNGNANGRTWAMGSSGNFFYMGFQNGSTGGSLQTFLQVSGPNRDLYLVPTSGNVGIGTTAPAALLQINSGTPTSATRGIQFGDDTGTRLYRSASGIITCSGTIAATFSGNLTGNATNVTGVVALANGGSGQTSAQAAMNAFAGAVTSGSYLRGNGTNVVMSTIQAADVPTLNQSTTGNAATASLATTSDRLTSRDNRTISSNEDDAFRLRFGFTSWTNNDNSPYADYLHLRSYSDASGGNDNLVMFRKDAIGMRIYQAGFGTSVAYSSFKDVAFTDQSFFIGTTSVAINRASAALTLNGVNISGTAASETLGTVTGRGASTTTQISVATAAGGSMYTGTKVGTSYGDGISGATFKSITDNPNGGSYAFAAYFNGVSGTNSFFVGADGSGYFRSTLTTSVIKGDAGADYPHSFTNTDAGNTHWTNRSGRLLTSNGAGWQTDGRDPIMALVTSGNSNSLNIANSIGLALHNESATNNTFSPAIAFSNLSNSGGYNTTYAAIIGRKTGQGIDTNWSAGELHFYTMPVGAYESNIPSLIINSAGNLGIGTTNPVVLLQVGTGTPTATANGVQFGDDTSARLYRSSSGVVSASNSFSALGGFVYASNYLQTGGNLIYPASFSATQRLEIGNAAQNAWITGISIAPGGNVVVAGTLTESSSIRYKENIETIFAPILPKLNQIRPVTYNKKDNPKHIEYGIIAEELNELFPEFVNKNEKGEVESVNYSRLTVLLIKAVKELKQEIEILKNK